MKKSILFSAILMAGAFQVQAQQDDAVMVDSLSEVVVTANRINLPFTENSRTINLITSADIKNSAAVNVTDLLQQVAGVDIRRRGTGGSQADLYIRGGGFDQTLLLIDGVKMAAA